MLVLINSLMNDHSADEPNETRSECSVRSQSVLSPCYKKCDSEAILFAITHSRIRSGLNPNGARVYLNLLFRLRVLGGSFKGFFTKESLVSGFA